MSELKECPFCLGDAEVDRVGTPRQSCIINCTECGCILESNETGSGDAWNSREGEAYLLKGLKSAIENLDAELLCMPKREILTRHNLTQTRDCLKTLIKGAK